MKLHQVLTWLSAVTLKRRNCWMRSRNKWRNISLFIRINSKLRVTFLWIFSQQKSTNFIAANARLYMQEFKFKETQSPVAIKVLKFPWNFRWFFLKIATKERWEEATNKETQLSRVGEFSVGQSQSWSKQKSKKFSSFNHLHLFTNL